MGSGLGRTALVTGGAGFIGSNLTERLLSETDMQVRIFDNFSRGGAKYNREFLLALPGSDRLRIIDGDVRNGDAIGNAVKGVTEIYHLAAQVAVTTSISDPVADFEVNMLGTMNVLEAARRSPLNPFVLYTSTNKVYGSLSNTPVEMSDTRYRFADHAFRGVAETENLDFHSPYGCSKGAADQYVRDYARIYGLPTVVFRMSCIAGPRQFGNEDQGWVAHFLYSVLAELPVTIYGNGFQVRDVLHVHDLVDAMLLVRGAKKTYGEVYNLGGGVDRTCSVREMLRLIESKTGKVPRLMHGEVRPGDQPLYISDTNKLQSHVGWKARRSIDRIIEDIHLFWQQNQHNITECAVHHMLIPELIEEGVA